MLEQSTSDSFWAWQKNMLSMPTLGSRHGGDVDEFIIYVHWLMLVLFVLWSAYFVYVLFKFNSRSNPKADPVGVKGHASTWLEVTVALVEAVLLIGFAIPMWAKQVDDFPADKDATVIRVAAEQFSWNSRYAGPDGAFARQDMKLAQPGNLLGYDPEDPAGADDITPPLKDLRAPLIPLMDGDKPVLTESGEQAYKPVVIHLTSKDVIHSFKVNTLRICQDCMPGMSIPVHFEPTRTGRYLVTCAQLCGNGHASMNGWLTVETEEDFNAWVASNTAAAGGGGGGGFE